jgi:hypothetical protein
MLGSRNSPNNPQPTLAPRLILAFDPVANSNHSNRGPLDDPVWLQAVLG